MEKQLTGVRVRLAVDGQEIRADCSLFLESYGPPARWHGRIWNLSTLAHLKKGAKLTLTLPLGSTAEASVHRIGSRGAYDFQGEGLPPDF